MNEIQKFDEKFQQNLKNGKLKEKTTILSKNRNLNMEYFVIWD